MDYTIVEKSAVFIGNDRCGIIVKADVDCQSIDEVMTNLQPDYP